MKKNIFFFILLLFSLHTQADSVVGGTEILPKGVRAIFYQRRNYTVNGQYNGDGSLSAFQVQEKIQIKSILGLSPKMDAISEGLNAEEKAALSNTTLAELNFQPQIEANVDVFGFGYGLTPKLMLGFGFPIIDAKVKMNYQLIRKPEQARKLALELRAKSKDEKADETRRSRLEALASALESAPELQESHIQYYLTHSMGYEPLGDWQAQDFGDARMFLHYNFNETRGMRNGLRPGLILPTGRKDDPDILNDISFSNEAWGAYLESRNDLSLIPAKWMLSASVLYEHSFPAKKEMRVNDDGGILSDHTEYLNYQRGDLLEARVGTGWHFTEAFEVFYHQTWRQKFKDVYDSYEQLSSNTDDHTRAYVYGFNFSSVAAYWKNPSIPPMKISLARYEMNAGIHTEKVDYTFIEAQIYF